MIRRECPATDSEGAWAVASSNASRTALRSAGDKPSYSALSSASSCRASSKVHAGVRDCVLSKDSLIVACFMTGDNAAGLPNTNETHVSWNQFSFQCVMVDPEDASARNAGGDLPNIRHSAGGSAMR